jgi:hypothetical protein
MHSSATWTGSVSNDFNVAGNWDINCVPAAGMNIVISSGSPTITGGNLTVNGIAISNGATLHLNDGAILQVQGNCVNDGTIVSGGATTDGKLLFSGSIAQNISGSGNFSNIEISNTIDVFVLTTITAKSVLTLTGAKLTANPGITVNINP